MTRLLLIALGGALGALARYAVSAGIGHAVQAPFPFGTLVVNASGSFAMGVVYELASLIALPPAFRELTAIGFLGAYTTFSTLAVEASALLRDREVLPALLYLVATVLSGLLLCFAGMILGRLLTRAL